MRQSLANKLLFKYGLADSWFSSAETFIFIPDLNQPFVMPLKSNPKVALSEIDHQQGRYESIESLGIEQHQGLAVWVSGVDFHSC